MVFLFRMPGMERHVIGNTEFASHTLICFVLKHTTMQFLFLELRVSMLQGLVPAWNWHIWFSDNIPIHRCQSCRTPLLPQLLVSLLWPLVTKQTVLQTPWLLLGMTPEPACLNASAGNGECGVVAGCRKGESHGCDPALMPCSTCPE